MAKIAVVSYYSVGLWKVPHLQYSKSGAVIMACCVKYGMIHHF